MEPEVEDTWICEASHLEKLYEQAHKRGTFLMVYQLSLSTVLPIKEDQVRRSLGHLRRKCPTFRICFGEHNGNLWFRKSKNDEIDFQVINDKTTDEVRYELDTYQYNSGEGPLWCARLLVDKEKDFLAIDEGFPYTSHLLLGAHHSIVDGTSMLNILGTFVQILEDVIAGKPVCDEQIGYFVSDLENEKLVSGKLDMICDNPSLMKELSDTVNEKGKGKSLLLCAFPPPEDGEDKMANVTKFLDKDTTKRFIAKCKTEGVTVHSGFTALANLAVVKLLLKKKIIHDSYRMCNGHIINLRRYWSGDTSRVLGSHAHFPLCLWTDIPKDIQMANFWDSARAVHQDLHHHVKEESVLLREAFLKLSFPDPTFDGIFYPKYPQQMDSSFTNLGNITASLTEGDFM